MKAVWLLHTRISWVQQRHLSALSQKCVPCLGEWAKQRNPFIRCKTMDHLTAVTCHRRFSTEVASGVEVPISATEQLENLTPEQREKLEKLKVEVEIMRAYGQLVPDEISNEQWLRLLESRKQFYKEFCLKKWYYHEKRMREYDKSMEDYLAKSADEGTLGTFLLPVTKGDMNKHYDNNLAHAFMNEPTVILDLEFDHLLGTKELSFLAEQIKQVYKLNRMHPDPFHLHLCGLKKNTLQYSKIKEILPDLEELFVTISEQSYIDLYPKDNLVYLSPDASEELKKYKHSDVYIVGGHFDRGYKRPVTATKARVQGIRYRKLPLDRYLRWGPGVRKSLPLNTVMSILLDLRLSRDWIVAFKHIHASKLKPK